MLAVDFFTVGTLRRQRDSLDGCSDREAVTDERGAYQFSRLVPGRYGVTADLAGFRSAAQENAIVNADATAQVDLTLEIGQLEEGIVVKGKHCSSIPRAR